MLDHIPAVPDLSRVDLDRLFALGSLFSLKIAHIRVITPHSEDGEHTRLEILTRLDAHESVDVRGCQNRG